MPPNILIVDDDSEIRTLLQDFLQKNGFRAASAEDGIQARRELDKSAFDLIVLDLMLPHESGFDICRDLRTKSSVPIIMLTARGDEVDRVLGLEIGADDYVPKPFSPRELVSRIRAVLRRTSGAADVSHTGQEFRFAGWTLDLMTRSLLNEDDQPVSISGTEFKLMALLLDDAPRVVSRARIMHRLHGREIDPLDRSIDVLVSRLRQILGDDARAPKLLKTVYGEGYVIGVKVERHA